MIDISIGDDATVSVEMTKYYFDYSRNKNNQIELLKMIVDIIDRVKYSGETISVHKLEGDYKYFVKEW